MRVHLSLLLVTTAFRFLSAMDVEHTLCGPGIPVVSVSVEPCSRLPCKLARGSTTTFQIQFEAEDDIGSFGRAELYLVTWGLAVPFPLDKPEICRSVRPTCPLQAGVRYTYTKSTSIPKSHPRVGHCIC
ncbi:Phosphatidylglycerol/phosphatidylinositol transfer protein, variant 2 [Clonorchis sinensis]|uniref:Phosphatidylglycerol/phosphatidylinositol transfer protein, variant 2 n=1 Tax=Clonorchis sinensis TaxID=79923 RepID=A0A8T1MC92_CLOSI|nr:Phosphatidylglycerol/phosphatidylinositol transfer protein, variant 2 [Clonorchis sinensis]